MDRYAENKFYTTHASIAMGSVTLGTLMTHPLDVTKVILQVGSNSGKEVTLYQALRRLFLLSGTSGLYSGFGWGNTGRILSLGLRFGVYEIATAYINDGLEDTYLCTHEAITAGIIAGAVEGLICPPFDLFKVRTQITAASGISKPKLTSENSSISPLIDKLLRGYAPNLKALNYSAGLLSNLPSKHVNLVGALRKYPWMITGSSGSPPVSSVRLPSAVLSLEGWPVLWRGLRSGLFRDAIYGGVFFGCWQFVHQAMLDWKAVGMNPVPRYNKDVDPLSPLGVSFAAGFSASVAAAASHFLDTSQTRSLCAVIPKYLKMEKEMLRCKVAGKYFERVAGIHPEDKKVLSRGIWLRMARSGIATFATVGSYYVGMRFLGSSFSF